MSRGLSFSGKGKGSGKTWVHPPEALLRGHIVYNVKFLGHVEVDSPKGTEVVKEAIRKMKFNKQIKRAEGQKPPKVELTISVDGVTVQEPKYKVTQHQYPLHRISYCADDKSDKRMFTFIAKEADTNKHFCFVFDSQQCAEEITLTIGQAFDLAYKKFLETSGKDMDTKKQYLLLQKKVQQLTEENLNLKARVADLERLIDPRVLEEFDKNNAPAKPASPVHSPADGPVVGRKLENLVMEDEYASVMKNGTASTGPASVPALAPPPKVPSRHHHHPPVQTTPTSPQGSTDLFGATPFNTGVTSPMGEHAPPIPSRQQQPQQNPFMTNGSSTGAGDPFGMTAFNPNATTQELDKQIQGLDKELLDLQAGFSRGLTMGTDDFSLEDLDPLNQK